MPSPEDPEHASLSSDYVSGLEYPEYLALSDKEVLVEDQAYAATDSPIALSPGYIADSDPEEDPKDESEDGPTDYPAGGGDDDDDDDSSGDDADDEDKEEASEDEDEEEAFKDEEEEEEHLAPADSTAAASLDVDHVPSAEETEPFDTDESAATPPPPAYRTTTRMSIRARTPIPFLSEAEVDRILAIPTPPSSPLTSLSSLLPQIPSPPFPVPSPLTTSPTDVGAPLGYKAAGIRTPPSGTPSSRTPPLLPIPLPTSSPPLLLPSTDCKADVPEVTLPPQKRLCIALGPRFEVEERSSSATARPTRGFRADYGFVGTLDAEIRHDPDREIGYGITDVWDDPDEIAEEIPASDVPELGQRMTNFVTTVRQDTDEIYKRLDDAQSDRSLMIGQLNLLRRDRHFHARTARLMESEARAAREAWVPQTIGTLVEALTLMRTLQTQMVALQSQQRPAGDPAHPDVPEEAGSSS
ncbi:hypothetical protein Tco_1433071 [Tanacetum coccineum]